MRYQYYFSTFISGFSGVIKTALSGRFENTTIEELLDGLVVYRTNVLPQEIKRLRFFNNSYLLLSCYKFSAVNKIELITRESLQKADWGRASKYLSSKHAHTFRVVISKENQTVSINKKVLLQIEKTISRKFNLKLKVLKPDTEFWLLIRREGICLFGVRITTVGGEKRIKLAKGELRPELAHLLCLISEPQKTDVFLDPFCGSGAIPLERAKSFSFKEILAGDTDSNNVDLLRKKTKQMKRKIKVENWDALNLEALKDSSIDKIITDPPWGLYKQESIDFISFYSKMLKEFYRILKASGLAVLLVGKNLEFEKSINSLENSFRLESEYSVLVSGKKASVYKLRKLK